MHTHACVCEREIGRRRGMPRSASSVQTHATQALPQPTALSVPGLQTSVSCRAFFQLSSAQPSRICCTLLPAPACSPISAPSPRHSLWGFGSFQQGLSSTSPILQQGRSLSYPGPKPFLFPSLGSSRMLPSPSQSFPLCLRTFPAALVYRFSYSHMCI